MARIAITATSFCKNTSLVAYAHSELAGHELLIADPNQRLAGESLRDFLRDCDGLLVGREAIDAPLIAELPRLKAVSVYGVGYDNVDTEALHRQGIVFYVEPGVNADAVAELTLGLTLATMRNISHLDAKLHQGVWEKNGGRQLSGRTVAVIGCGAVGGRVAHLFRAFGCKLLLCDIIPKPELARAVGGVEVQLAEALAKADLVTLHVPLTPLTRNMMNPTTLAQMRRGSYLINTSRGAVIDEEALCRALQTGQLTGAGLDVFATEPVTNKELYSLPQLVGTPHIGGNSVEAVEAMGRAAIKYLKAHFTV